MWEGVQLCGEVCSMWEGLTVMWEVCSEYEVFC